MRRIVSSQEYIEVIRRLRRLLDGRVDLTLWLAIVSLLLNILVWDDGLWVLTIVIGYDSRKMVPIPLAMISCNVGGVCSYYSCFSISLSRVESFYRWCFIPRSGRQQEVH